MFAVAMIASIAFAAPGAESHVEFPVESYVITATVAQTLLPVELRGSLDPILSDRQIYDRFNAGDVQPAAANTESAIGHLMTALATQSPDKLSAAVAECIRMATRAALRYEADIASPLIAGHHARLMFETRVDPRRMIGEPSVEALWEKVTSGGSKVLAQLAPDDLDGKLAVVESRLEIAALLSAKMILKAWHESGEPGFARVKPTPDLKAQNDIEYVASKNSKVFHKQSCPHVSRIKKANLIRFESISKARATGRKSCKTCNPTG